MSRAGRWAALVLALLITGGTAADSVRPDVVPVDAQTSAGNATYDVLPTGGGLEDCGCTGGARARSRIELGLIPGHKPQDVPEIAPSTPQGATPGNG